MSKERPEPPPEQDPERHKRLIESEPVRHPFEDRPDRKEYDAPLPIQQPPDPPDDPPDKQE